jgi:GNAT superfamily N-acetyltransferase
VITLRPYRDDDVDAVVSVWWDSWHSIRSGLRHPHPASRWRARWRDEIVPRQQVVVATDDGEVIGFAAADVAARVLTQIFIAPARKRQGIGGRLFAWARESMPSGFILHTLVDNVGSRAFYERHGLVAGDAEINPANGLRTVEYRWTPGSTLTRSVGPP